MITNAQSGTNVHEIADGIFRINTPIAIPGAGDFSFNQYLIVDDDPLLFHTGPRRMFPLVREAVARVLPVERLRYLAFSHFEADECGALNEWLASAPRAQPVCGRIGAMTSVDDVADNVFAVSSRINSTWGGNLVDMVRSRRILEVIEADRLFDRAADMGAYLLGRLGDLAGQLPGVVSDVRGRGLMCAFSLPSGRHRDAVLAALWERGVIMLGSGPDSVRFRPALTVTRAEIDRALAAIAEL